MRQFISFVLGMLVIASAGCKTAPVKHYAIQAEVISVDAPKKMLTLKHGDIPGLMPAMTMDYLVADENQIVPLKLGDKISADLVIGENVGHLEKILVVEKAAAPAPQAAPPK
ncbi:MAG TPA: copper-binding protein [Candidatus Acidoferrum sp.]|nr:copper-binding protein [Candidatus Acidoferrum sp.]